MLRRIGAFGVMGAAFAVLVAMTLSGTASAKVAGSAVSTVSCKAPVTIGVAYPETGPVATLGANQWDWAQAARDAWNANHSIKIQLIQGDTQLAGNNPQAVQVAQAFSNNPAIVAVTGPAGSQEMQDTASIWKNAGLAPVSGSETRVALTRGSASTPRETSKGYFYRTVPNDGQQGDNVATYIYSKLHKKSVEIIDDEEAYSTGLAAQVMADLKKDHVKVSTNHISQQDTNFSSVIDSIPAGTQLIYIPWQNATQAQQFYTQLHNAGKTQVLFGSDGTDVPGTFNGTGSFVSGFPVDFSSPQVQAFQNSHGGDPETFGIPTYTSVWVNASAIQAACKDNKNLITRAEVRKKIGSTVVAKAKSLLGFKVAFLKSNQGKFQGPGDMGGTASFGIYQIQANGDYKRVG